MNVSRSVCQNSHTMLCITTSFLRSENDIHTHNIRSENDIHTHNILPTNSIHYPLHYYLVCYFVGKIR